MSDKHKLFVIKLLKDTDKRLEQDFLDGSEDWTKVKLIKDADLVFSTVPYCTIAAWDAHPQMILEYDASAVNTAVEPTQLPGYMLCFSSDERFVLHVRDDLHYAAELNEDTPDYAPSKNIFSVLKTRADDPSALSRVSMALSELLIVEDLYRERNKCHESAES